MLYQEKKRPIDVPSKFQRMLPIFSLLLILAGLTIPSFGYAQTDEGGSSSFLRGASSVKKLELSEGASDTIILPRDAKEIFISDPDVADAVARNARTLFIIGKSTGRASIVVSDKDNQEIMTIALNIGRDLNILRQTLKAAIPTGEIDFTVNNASIILTGFVDSADDAISAQDIAKTFFTGTQTVRGVQQTAEVINSLKIRGKDQVMIKVTIAEVQRNVLKTFETNSQYGTGKNALADKLSGGLLTGTDGTGIFSLIGNNAKIDITALERNGVARTLAEPTLVAISGETAKFKAGGQIAVPTDRSWAGGTLTNTYTYKDVGVMLEFTPMVLSEGRISLKIKTEVNELDSETTVGLMPGFKTRNTETVIELPSGASMVTAGLIQQNQRAQIRGTPGLMSLPILGTLFRSREFQNNETELMIIVTPYIAKSMQPSQIAKPTDGLVFASEPQAILLGRINKIYGVPNQKSVARSNKNIGYIYD